MDDFEKELKAGFLEEVTQLMSDTEQCFLSLESAPNDSGNLDKIFRLAHNLKGSAKAVGFDELGAFTHQLESYLLKIKNGEIAIQSSAVSLLLRCNDHIGKMIEALKQDFDAKTDCSELLSEIHAQMAGGSASNVGPQEVSVPTSSSSDSPIAAEAVTTESTPLVPQSEDARFEDLDVVVTKSVRESQAEGQSPSIPAANLEPPHQAVTSMPHPVAAPVAVAAPPQASKSAGSPPASHGAQTDESIRVSLNRLEKLINFVGELVILQTVLKEQMNATNSVLIRKTVQQLGKVTKEVQDISMGLRMVPLKQTFQKMQRIVRDTTQTLGKKVNLTLQGEETEVDKTVLENLGDPLVHLIRNACDHGVESPEARLKSGKSEAGNILLNAYHQSGSLVIEIKDDGAGLNPEKLKAKAIEKGILKPSVNLTEREAYNLIFANGFSTKTEVTDVSGRGVGMDVVKTNIERLQGEIQIESGVGKGTCFKVRLPLTLAIIDAMVICCEQSRFVVPLSHIHESVKPNLSDLTMVTGMGELYTLRGESMPLYRLNQLLGRKTPPRPANECIAIVVRNTSNAYAVLVDDIVGQYQVVIKKLGLEHANIKGFNGSAILGDGRPALILELPELVAGFKPPAVSATPLASTKPATTKAVA